MIIIIGNKKIIVNSEYAILVHKSTILATASESYARSSKHSSNNQKKVWIRFKITNKWQWHRIIIILY